MLLKKPFKIALVTVFSIAMLLVCYKFIRHASEATVLLQSGRPVKAEVTGACVPFPMPVSGQYYFCLNNKSFFGTYDRRTSVKRIGDTIDVLYLSKNPNLNMSYEDVKVHASSAWSIFVFSN